MIPRGRLLRAAALALYPACAAGVTALSLVPAPPVMPSFRFMDKLEHLAAYLALGGLGAAFFSSLKRGNLLTRGIGDEKSGSFPGGRASLGPAIASFATALVLGAAIEFIQPLTGRTLDPADLVCNAAGAALGSVAAFIALRRAALSRGAS